MANLRRNTLGTATALVLLLTACGSAEPAGQESPSTTSTGPGTQATSTSTAAPAPSTTSTTTTSTTTTTTTTEPPPAHAISFTTEGWPELANGAHYEGWLVVDGAPLSTGRFNVIGGVVLDLDGNTVDEFALDFDPAEATTVVVTIEPANDEDSAPSDTHFLAGDASDGGAILELGHPAALGTGFEQSSGEFVLATPTDGDRVNDEFSGVWFLTFPGPKPGLDLPGLPEGWVYEGWTLIEGIPVTTGTFRDVDRSDNEAPYSGTVRTPNFPGEDFLDNAPVGLTFPTNLQGATVVISVEPLTEDNPLPFAIKPLSGPIPLDAELEPAAYPLTSAGFDPIAGIATYR